MINKIIFSILLVVPFITKAQITINAQLPPGGLVQKEQLWNLVIANNKAEILDVSIKMNLQDAVTGQVVLSASTGNILLGKGVKIISNRDIQPVQYNYNVQDVSRTFLPMGNYTACYRLMKNDDGQEALGEDCISINIDPLSPPLLNTPADNSILEIQYPQFTWMPPTPFDMFSNLSYDLLVTELLPGQNATDAIQYNTPIYSRSNLSQPYENYSSSFTKLEIGKTYAWQVVAKNGQRYSAKTAVWIFKIKDTEKPLENTNNTYFLLDDNVTGNYITKANIIHVRYYSGTATYSGVFIFSDEKGNIIKKITKTVVAGDNYFDLNITGSFLQNKLYKCTLTDKENKTHTLTFSINKK